MSFRTQHGDNAREPERIPCAPNSGLNQVGLCSYTLQRRLGDYRPSVGRSALFLARSACLVLESPSRLFVIMAKSTTTPSRVRSREAMEHQSRLTLSSAKDHAYEREMSSDPASRSADRFIPFRATSDQSGLDDLRSPNQCTSREVSILSEARFHGTHWPLQAMTYCALIPQASTPGGSAFRTLLACQLGIKTPPKDAQFPLTFSTPSPMSVMLHTCAAARA